MQAIVEKVLSDIMGWLPAFLNGILFIIVGVIAAWLIGLALSKLLHRIGVDRLAEKAGVTRVMTARGFSRPISIVIGRFSFWAILIIFVFAAAESMGLSIVAGLFNTALMYVPNLLGAFLILLIGSLLAGIVGDAIGALDAAPGNKHRPFLGQLVKYTLYVFVFILAIHELGVDTMLLSSVVISVLATISFALVLAFGLGSRQLARNILAGFHARETFEIGARVKVRDHAGVLTRIGTYKFVLENDKEWASLPNHYLTEEEVVIYPADE